MMQKRNSGGRFLAIALILAVLMSAGIGRGQGASTAPDAEKTQTSKGEAIVQAVEAYMQGLRTFQVDTISDWLWSHKGVTQQRSERVRLSAVRPGAMALRGLNNLIDGEVYIHNKEVLVYRRFLNQYWQGTLQGDLTQLKGESALLREALGNPVHQMLLEGKIASLMGKIKDIVWLEENARENGAEHHLKLISASPEEPDVELWVVMGEKVYVEKIRFDFDKVVAQLRRTMPAGEIPDFTIEISLANWQMNGAIDASEWTWTPPHHARRVIYFETEEQQKHPLVGKSSPEYTLHLLDSSEKTLASHREQDIVIMDFWAIRCQPCREALPAVTEITDAYRGKGVVFYAVNIEDGKEQITAFLQEQAINPLVVRDSDKTGSGLFRVSGIPQTVVIDRKGKIQSVHVGYDPRTAENLKAEIEALLAGMDIEGLSESARIPVKLVLKEAAFTNQQSDGGSRYSLAATLSNEGTQSVPAYSYALVIQAANQQPLMAAGSAAIEPGTSATLTLPSEDWSLTLAPDSSSTVRVMLWPSKSLQNQSYETTKEVKLPTANPQ